MVLALLAACTLRIADRGLNAVRLRAARRVLFGVCDARCLVFCLLESADVSLECAYCGRLGGVTGIEPRDRAEPPGPMNTRRAQMTARQPASQQPAASAHKPSILILATSDSQGTLQPAS